jgi:hypothetical protein
MMQQQPQFDQLGEALVPEGQALMTDDAEFTINDPAFEREVGRGNRDLTELATPGAARQHLKHRAAWPRR